VDLQKLGGLDMIFTLTLIFAITFANIWYWRRLAGGKGVSGFAAALMGSALAILLFAACFALGIWYSLARLRGEGWPLGNVF
jgi:hypothetical protein